jgi:biopolymer transport protein ExbD
VKLGPTDLRAKEDEAEKIIPHQVDGSIDRMALENVMRTWKQKYPDRKDVVLNTEGNVNYGRMIALYDMLIQMEWSDVGINPN